MAVTTVENLTKNTGLRIQQIIYLLQKNIDVGFIGRKNGNIRRF